MNDYSLKQHFLTYNISFLSQFFYFLLTDGRTEGEGKCKPKKKKRVKKTEEHILKKSKTEGHEGEETYKYKQKSIHTTIVDFFS